MFLNPKKFSTVFVEIILTAFHSFCILLITCISHTPSLLRRKRMYAHFTQHGTTPSDKTSVIICLGRHQKPHEQTQRVRLAVQLAKSQNSLLIFTGFENEASEMYEQAITLGLPHEYPVVLEQEAQHTRMNSELCASILRQLGYCLKETLVTVVTCAYHARRSFLSFRVDMNNVQVASIQPKGFFAYLAFLTKFWLDELPRIIRYRDQLYENVLSFKKAKIPKKLLRFSTITPP